MKTPFQISFSLLLLLSISWQCVAKSVIFINFKLHQEELSKTVCENKDKPMSCCEAKCHLEKEIKKEDKRQAELPAGIKDKVEKTELRTGLPEFVFCLSIQIQTMLFSYCENVPTGFFSSVFHPPS